MNTSTPTADVQALIITCPEIGTTRLIVRADEAGVKEALDCMAETMRAIRPGDETTTFEIEAVTYSPAEWAAVPERDFEGWDA